MVSLAVALDNRIEEPSADQTASLSQLGSDDLYKRLKRWFQEDMRSLGDWRERAEEDYAFVAGEEGQWDQRDIDSLKAKFRPVITFNRIQPLILSVTGEQINNAMETRFVPREQGDIKPNEMLSAGGDFVREQCDAEDEESESFWDAAVCGVGVTETRLDMETDPEEPNVVIERIDPFEVLWDGNAKKRNLSDAKRVWRIRSNIPIEDAEEEYPDIATSDLDASWAALDPTGKIADQDESRQYAIDFKDNRKSELLGDKTITQVQCEWWEYEKYYKAIDPFSGEMVRLTEEEHNTLSRRVSDLAAATGAPDLRLQSMPLRRRIYMQAFLGRTILKKKRSPCPDRFTFNFITGYRDRNKNQWYGLVRSMKDPQRWANKWLSQSLHLMNSTAKGGIMAERDITENETEFAKSWAKSDEVTWLEPGTLAQGKLEQKPQAAFPAGFYQMMEFAVSSIRDVSGVSLEQIGMREATQAASLEYQRRQAGITILAVLFKSMRRYHKNSGRVLLYFIQNYLSDGRLIKIVGDEGRQYVPLVRQADIKYDVIVDEGPSSPNQKERVWELIGQNFWQLPQELQAVFIEYSPFPSGVVDKVKQASKQASESPSAQLQQQMLQFQTQLEQLKGYLTKAQAEQTQAETAKIVQELQNPQGQGGLQPDHAALIEAAKVQAQAGVQHEKNAQTYALGQQKILADTASSNQQAATEAQITASRGATDAQLTARRDSMNAAVQREKTATTAKTTLDKQMLTELFRPKPKANGAKK